MRRPLSGGFSTCAADRPDGVQFPAGGLGALAAGPLPAEAVRNLIRAVRSATDRPFNVNFITFFATEDHIQTCIDEHVSVVSFPWGHPPGEFIARLHDAGIRVWEQVGSVEAAREAVDSSIDLIVAQGSQAGGHNDGSLPTFVLVPAILEAIAPTPVLAAGGIASGWQLAAALLPGADGVSVGTRFVASHEALAHPDYKRRLVEAGGTQTRLSSVYGRNMPDFNSIRVVDMGRAHEFAGREEMAPRDLDSQPVIGSMRTAGETIPLHRFSSFVPTPDTEGCIEELPFVDGQGAGLIHGVMPVSEIMDTLVSEAVSALAAVQVT